MLVSGFHVANCPAHPLLRHFLSLFWALRSKHTAIEHAFKVKPVQTLTNQRFFDHFGFFTLRVQHLFKSTSCYFYLGTSEPAYKVSLKLKTEKCRLYSLFE